MLDIKKVIVFILDFKLIILRLLVHLKVFLIAALFGGLAYLVVRALIWLVGQLTGY